MNSEQIRKLDRCREESKNLHIKTGQIQESLKELTCHGNHDFGKEIDEIFKTLRSAVNKSLLDAGKEIEKLIEEI